MPAQRCAPSLAAGALGLILGALFVAPTAGAQAPARAQAPAQAATQAPAPVPPADPADVESIDAIITALYASISGDAGVKRDWDRMRSLFAPGARLIPTAIAPDGAGRHRMMTPDEYVELAGVALERDGFHEREIGRRMDRYGRIVHVFSAYESKRKLSDPAPFMRGINSIQLWNDGKRWWVLSVFWEHESPGNPVPAEYLNKP